MDEKVVLYLRASKNGQHTENQLQPLEQFCKSRGYRIVKVYSENESAFLDGHQREWAQLLHDAEARRFKVVVCWALDRISRQGPAYIFGQIAKLRRFGVILVSVQEQWLEGLGEMSDLFVAMLAWVANFESRRRSQRTLLGLARAQAEGKRLGRPIGSKDKTRRKRGGYFNRYSNKPSVTMTLKDVSVD